MKNILVIFIFWMGCMLAVQAQQHPCVYVSPSDKVTVRQKVKMSLGLGKPLRLYALRWKICGSSSDRSRVDHFPSGHVLERGGALYPMLSEKQNWDRGEGNAPVPTVRMPGMRTWNKYANVPLEQRIPYNETGDMLGINKLNPSEPPVKVPYKESGHMVRGNNVEILTLAEMPLCLLGDRRREVCPFCHRYIQCMAGGNLLYESYSGPRKSCGSSGGWEPGGICGYYDYEQIHDDLAMHAAMVYDFAFDYLSRHPHAHLKEIGKDTKSVAVEVFKRFIDIGLVRGGKSGNWNVNGWNMMLRPVLVLDSDEAYPDGKGKEYYLNLLVNESTPYHDAIPDMLKTYDPVTGLWPESPGYSFGTIQMLLDWAAPLKRAGIDIIAGNPIYRKRQWRYFLGWMMLPTWWFSVIHVEEALISRLLRIYWLTMPGLLIKRVWKKWRVP